MQIVLIDDGVNEKYFNLKPLKHDLEIDREQKLSVRKCKNELICSHGTICAAIILKYAPDAVISSIKILNLSDGRGRKEQLLAALGWCLENQAKIINLSIGSTSFQDFKEIRQMISRLYRKGCIIVAAYNNRNIYTMPASMGCTIGVKCNPALRMPSYRARISKFESFIEAPGEHEFKNFYLKKFVSTSSSSFATPYITAIVHNLMVKNNSYNFTDILRILFKINNIPVCFVPDFIDHAVVVDLTGNEMTELFYFSVDKIYNETTIGEMNKIDDFVNIVILAKPDYCMLPLLKEFNSIEQYIRGIYFCFKSDGVDCIGNSLFGRIWIEKYYLNKFAHQGYADKNIKDHYQDTHINIPLVYIYGKKEILIKLLQDLENMFLEAKYAIKIIGEFKCAYLYGFDYIDCTENRKSIVYNIYSLYKPDIIICGIDSQVITHDEEDLCFDLEFECKNSGKGKALIYGSDTIYSRILSAFK